MLAGRAAHLTSSPSRVTARHRDTTPPVSPGQVRRRLIHQAWVAPASGSETRVEGAGGLSPSTPSRLVSSALRVRGHGEPSGRARPRRFPTFFLLVRPGPARPRVDRCAEHNGRRLSPLPSRYTDHRPQLPESKSSQPPKQSSRAGVSDEQREIHFHKIKKEIHGVHAWEATGCPSRSRARRVRRRPVLTGLIIWKAIEQLYHSALDHSIHGWLPYSVQRWNLHLHTTSPLPATPRSSMTSLSQPVAPADHCTKGTAAF